MYSGYAEQDRHAFQSGAMPMCSEKDDVHFMPAFAELLIMRVNNNSPDECRS